jgi:hypothetical protein
VSLSSYSFLEVYLERDFKNIFFHISEILESQKRLVLKEE